MIVLVTSVSLKAEYQDITAIQAVSGSNGIVTVVEVVEIPREREIVDHKFLIVMYFTILLKDVHAM